MLKTISIAACLFMLATAGCSDSDSDLSGLNGELTASIARFENAEANFGPSTNYDQLIANSHWLDRMAEEINAIEGIESRAVSLGAEPIPGVRLEIASRFRRRLASVQSDAEYLNVMSQFEIAKIWLEI